MGRPTNSTPIQRYNVGLAAPAAQWVKERAYEQRTSQPAVIAHAVEEARLRQAGGWEAEEAGVRASGLFQEVVRENEELTRRVKELRRRLAERDDDAAGGSEAPRWAWPLELLLADVEWWERWLPRLYELLGREIGNYARGNAGAVDDRGYVDLMTFLFPSVGGRCWRDPEYCRSIPVQVRVKVWEPVIRHVALAIAALEAADQPGTDPYVAMRSRAEITGSWTAILRHLLGECSPELPRAVPA